MNYVTHHLEDTVPSVAIGDDVSSLSDVLHPSCSAAIWRRQAPPFVQTWLDDLHVDTLPNGRVVVHSDAVSKTVGQLFDMANMPDGPERQWLQEDITSLAETFSNLMQAEYLRLRLEAVKTNACRKFHIDAITARLVCTYRGTGTQYGVSANGAAPDRVFTVPTGAPILLRGTLWPADPASGLLHRSPPIEGTGETRLLLVLDPVFELKDEE